MRMRGREENEWDGKDGTGWDGRKKAGTGWDEND
jgi:hypothetical protein